MGLLFALLVAAALGGADVLPGGSAVRRLIGLQEANAEAARCTNTDCTGSNVCSWDSYMNCYLTTDPMKCTSEPCPE